MLGNDDPKASVVGEIIPGKEFYDYEAKYLSEGSVPVIPAKLTKRETKQIREMAVAAFRACDLAGLARVDFLMEPDGKRRIFLNEVNTMPGFTQISMYPKLWEATGVKLQRADYAADRAGPGTAGGEEPDGLQQRRVEEQGLGIRGNTAGALLVSCKLRIRRLVRCLMIRMWHEWILYSA